MPRKVDAESAALVALLAGDTTARLVETPDGRYGLLSPARGHTVRFSAAAVRQSRASGLLVEAEHGAFAAAPVASAWMKRRGRGERPFRLQHGEIVEAKIDDGSRAFLDLEESPIGALARRATKSGEPWLKPHAAEAAERLRRDFEMGRLQPRVTANWSASVSTGRRSGDGSGIPDLTDSALGARIRFDRAMAAVGRELSGILVDVCCFLKGLETVERERRWPARSAKLVLRIALESLARHYGLEATATGAPGSREVRHWGTDDYRPEIT